MPDNRGARLFADYLHRKRLTQAMCARRLGVAKSYVGLLANARATPGLSVAARIEEVTEGAVPCRAWTEPPVD